MRAVLSTEIPISRIAVFAEIAWMERRPELGLLCRSARTNGNRISVATVQSVLSGLSDPGANNVQAWCRMLGLCDAQGGLTALGEDVAERDEAPVPEQGVYGLWIAQHPVIGRCVLSIERLSSTRDARFESIKPLPFEPDRGKVFRSVVDPKERFLVRALPTNDKQPSCVLMDSHATCRLQWTLDFNVGRDQWQFEGMIEAPGDNGKQHMRQMQHEPESEGLDLWHLAETWGNGPLLSFGRWQASERQLAVPFNSLSEAEIITFRKSLTLPSVEIPGKGSYDNVLLDDVPLGPASADDAQRWAMSRFDRHLAAQPAYRSRVELRELFVELAEGTSLERLSPTLPSHADLLSQASKDAERFWLLAAPVDLAPYPLPDDDLTAFHIGSSAPTPSSDFAGVVRVPYRSGWSMRKLVDQLLMGVAPRRVLLCDRYVRGDDNLATLELFVQALREASPIVEVEVWTTEGEAEADFMRIQGITSSAPRVYREVFGRSIPHDRYLLILSTKGQGFGWHMSNSPLHARPDVKGASPESPLRWKDLVGTRVTPDELEPALRQWLNGGGR